MIRRENLLCRPLPSTEEIVALAALAQDLPDCIITQSLAGSGADIEGHVHAKIFPKSAVSYPLLHIDYFEALSESPVVLVNRRFTYAIAICGTACLIGKVLASLMANFPYAPNLYFLTGHLCDGTVGIFVPRLRVFPQDKRFRRAKWKFGTMEVFGAYDARTEKLYSALTLRDLTDATRSVTLHDPHHQSRMEEFCKGLLRTSATESLRC